MLTSWPATAGAVLGALLCLCAAVFVAVIAHGVGRWLTAAGLLLHVLLSADSLLVQVFVVGGGPHDLWARMAAVRVGTAFGGIVAWALIAIGIILLSRERGRLRSQPGGRMPPDPA